MAAQLDAPNTGLFDPGEPKGATLHSQAMEAPNPRHSPRMTTEKAADVILAAAEGAQMVMEWEAMACMYR